LNIKAPLSTIIAIAVGVIVLAAYLRLLPVWISEMLLSAAVLLAGVAFLLGVVNLFSVHLSKITSGSSTALYSTVLLISMVITLLVTLVMGPSAPLPMWLFTYVQIPVETSIMAVLTFSLTFAALRLVIRRPGAYSLVFIAVFLITLIGSGPLFGLSLPFISDGLSPFISNVFVLAGARGILLGVGLGTVSTGLRILIGADRPFGG
jgi:hypothetical protein